MVQVFYTLRELGHFIEETKTYLAIKKHRVGLYNAAIAKCISLEQAMCDDASKIVLYNLHPVMDASKIKSTVVKVRPCALGCS